MSDDKSSAFVLTFACMKADLLRFHIIDQFVDPLDGLRVRHERPQARVVVNFLIELYALIAHGRSAPSQAGANRATC
jgi:hypothetical protein